MSWDEFIFSEKKSLKYTRHTVFWVLWGFAFYGSRYFYPKPFLSGQTSLNIPSDIRELTVPVSKYIVSADPWSTTEFIRSLLMLSVHMAGCYIVILILLRYVLQKKYFLFLAGFVPLILLLILLSRFIDVTMMPLLVDPNYNMPFYTSIFSGVISAIKIIFIAVAIKLGKYWWFKQKEKERLEKEKIEAELHLLKFQIHPLFLLSTLNNIHSFALSASPRAPEMLLKLSDILSYMLYDCNEMEVPLTKEIKILSDYMTLEKMRYGKKLEMNIQVTGNTGNYRIAPLLLLRFIEHSFHQSSNSSLEQAWINLEIQIQPEGLEMNLMNGKTVEPLTEEDNESNHLELAMKRLELLYPGRFSLKITEQPEILAVALQLQLTGLEEKKETLQQDSPLLGNIVLTEELPPVKLIF
ncbi:MAG TPA: histidine kinase [Chitinophagaceae bacterium]|nr:histidine kinase [Chitinophagaceae bacterium]